MKSVHIEYIYIYLYIAVHKSVFTLKLVSFELPGDEAFPFLAAAFPPLRVASPIYIYIYMYIYIYIYKFSTYINTHYIYNIYTHLYIYHLTQIIEPRPLILVNLAFSIALPLCGMHKSQKRPSIHVKETCYYCKRRPSIQAKKTC